MTYESREEKRAIPYWEEDRKKRMREEGDKAFLKQLDQKLYRGNQLPAPSCGQRDSLFGQQWMELIVEDLIKERAVDELHPLGNEINNYKSRIFADS